MYIRNMRKPSLIDPLMPKTRQLLLAAMLNQPDREWYLSDLARHLKVRPSSLQRELALLTKAGILTRRRDGNRLYYRPDPSCPILPELERIMVKTVGVADVLRAALRPLVARIRLAFLHGSIARGDARAGSDVDLLVVGDLGLADLVAPLRSAERRIGRPVNPTIYVAKEYIDGIRDGTNHFLATVHASPKIPLIGNEHELE